MSSLLLAASGFESLHLFGIALAALLVVILVVLLPTSGRHLVRQPALFLLLHVAALAVANASTEGTASHRFAMFAALALVLASIGRSVVVLVLDVTIGRRLTKPVPKIFHDIVQGVVYVGVVLTALRSAGVEPGSILTTSALLTAAVALSLQETLGNMVAGLAIQAQRPFDVGDWIQFDADTKHIGKVVEINWRATKVITLDEVEVIVPNATLAKAPITNFTKPSAASRRSLYVTVSAEVPPQQVQRLILDAIEGSYGVLRDPAPSVVTNAFVDGNIEYWIRFFTDLFHKRDGVDGAARDRVWYALGRAGIGVAAPARAVRLREESHEARARDEEQSTRRREDSLGRVDFLRVLSDEQRRMLAKASVLRLYMAGETIVREGEASAEMFIVESGSVAVVRERTHGEQELAKIAQGEFFGEMALMTGEKRNATVRAITPCTLLVVDHDAFKAVLDAAPDVADHVSQVIAERQAARTVADAGMEQAPSSVEERRSLLLSRIRKFFAL